MLFVLKIGNECFIIILAIIKQFILLILNFCLFQTSKMHVTSKWKMKRFQLLDFLIIWLTLPIQMDFCVYYSHPIDPEKPWIQYHPHKARKLGYCPLSFLLSSPLSVSCRVKLIVFVSYMILSHCTILTVMYSPPPTHDLVLMLLEIMGF